MYKAVVQMVLLYGIESWVVTDTMLKVLGGFHHQVDWWIAGISALKFGEGGVGVVIGGRGLGGGGDLSNEGLHWEAEGYHCRIYHESPHL